MSIYLNTNKPLKNYSHLYISKYFVDKSLIIEELNEVTQENDKLKKILGEKDLEIAILKDLLKKANPQLKIK